MQHLSCVIPKFVYHDKAKLAFFLVNYILGANKLFGWLFVKTKKDELFLKTK